MCAASLSAVRRLLWILIPSVLVLAVAGVVTAIVLSTFPGGSADEGTGAGSNPGAAREMDDDDFGTVLVYDVLDDGSLSPEPDGLALEIWEMFSRIASTDFAGESMLEYHVGDSDASDTMAFVSQADDPSLWILGANLATSDDRDELLATLIHEYAHILFLSTDQIDLEGECDADVVLWEGCPVDGAVVADFREQFWSAYDDAPPADNTDSDIAYDFYLAHEDHFVSDYAATNPIEDAAETFTTFVLEERPAADSTIAQKIGFFWDYAWLVEIREHIRAEFSGEHGLP